MGKLLFELGVEEIPARFLPSGKLQFEENFKKFLSEYRVGLQSIKVFVTPRRLSLIADLFSEQESEEKLIWGPPFHIAFDESGNPKEPAFAFAKAQGVELKDLQIQKKGKGNYVCVLIKEKGKKTEEILPQILESFVQSLNFPKMMRWGYGNFRFVRPIRWILALYEGQIIPFGIEGIRAGAHTYGHRFLSKNILRIENIDDYERILEENFVIVDQDKRRAIISEQAEKLALKVDGKIFWDEELLEEVTNLVEYPQAVLCSFSENYLNLPKELLITVMKDHQRYFAITDSSNQLKSYFVVISNTKAENEDNIIRGAERVIKARFEDAKFYYEEDLKKGINRLLEFTKGIIYHDKLGSLYDKTLRIKGIANRISNFILPDKLDLIDIASKYCKADLASGVVREFPELQGIMGGYYVEASGLPKEVAIAIREHYLPKGFSNEIPSNDIGCILSLSDKLDHISSFFYLGESPSGTEDPFGLRRAANGIITILFSKHYSINIVDLVSTVSEMTNDEIRKQLVAFLTQRFESFLEQLGYEVNLIKAVNHLIPYLPLYEVEQRLRAIRNFRDSDKFEGFYLALKRVVNIIRNYKKMPLRVELFSSPFEEELYCKMKQVEADVQEYLENHDFFKVLECLSLLIPVINNFFDRVLVMDKDEELKRNRLALLQELAELLKYVGDLSKIY